MRAVIFVNGYVADPAQLQRWLTADDYLIGADGGTVHCLALGLTPHAIVGDLDSLAPELVTRLSRVGVLIERHSPAKDQTDLELAVELAIAKGAQEVILLGSLGGRLDQMVANILLLAQRAWSIPILLAEDNQLAQVIQRGETLRLQAAPGDTVSVIPLSASVTGITYTGLQYPLVNATLALGSTRGVSNLVATAPATIHIEEGLLLVIQILAT